jgi:chromosomal replication initiation ATPase DnaA
MTRFSLPQVGRILGGRDHSTVWDGIASILAQAKRDPQTKRFIFDLCRELREKGLLHQKEQEA